MKCWSLILGINPFAGLTAWSHQVLVCSCLMLCQVFTAAAVHYTTMYNQICFSKQIKDLCQCPNMYGANCNQLGVWLGRFLSFRKLCKELRSLRNCKEAGIYLSYITSGKHHNQLFSWPKAVCQSVHRPFLFLWCSSGAVKTWGTSWTCCQSTAGLIQITTIQSHICTALVNLASQCRHRENMQTVHRKASDWIRTHDCCCATPGDLAE